MAEDTGRDRSQDRRLLECTSCGQRFYSYRVTMKAECPTCHTPTAKQVADEDTEGGTTARGRRLSKSAGSGRGCLGPLIVFLLVLAAGYAAYHFRYEIASQFNPGNQPGNTPENAPEYPEVETITNAPTDTPVDIDTSPPPPGEDAGGSQ